jgi:hypothetical protein
METDNDVETITTIDLADTSLGGVEEIPYFDKQRFQIGKWVLGAGAAFLAGACILLVVAGESVTAQANASKVFDFAKTSIPPIITLVLGFYFRDVQAQQSD